MSQSSKSGFSTSNRTLAGTSVSSRVTNMPSSFNANPNTRSFCTSEDKKAAEVSVVFRCMTHQPLHVPSCLGQTIQSMGTVVAPSSGISSGDPAHDHWVARCAAKRAGANNTSTSSSHVSATSNVSATTPLWYQGLGVSLYGFNKCQAESILVLDNNQAQAYQPVQLHGHNYKDISQIWCYPVTWYGKEACLIAGYNTVWGIEVYVKSDGAYRPDDGATQLLGCKVSEHLQAMRSKELSQSQGHRMGGR